MQRDHNNIEQVLLFKCGYCENNMKHVFRKGMSSRMVFPANVCCLISRKYGPILYDTGYSGLIFKNGILSKVYNLLNPARVAEEDYIIHKLRKYHIKSGDVKQIILSHAHPDHLGGLCFFENPRVIMSKEVYDTVRYSHFRDLVFKNMKQDFPVDVNVLAQPIRHPLLSKYFREIYDVLGDGSVLGIRLDGHAAGQIGIYIPDYKLFLGADSAWREEFMDQVNNMRFLPRLIQNNYDSYVETTERMRRFMGENPGITVIFSHSDIEEGPYGG